MKIAGCDVGKTSLEICVLSNNELSEIKDLKRFARKYKPLKITATAEDIEVLPSLPVKAFVLEPTGSYTYIWIEIFKRFNLEYRLVSPMRVRNYAKYKGLINKSDRNDCVAIAAYSLEEIDNSKAFLGLERMEVRELYLALAAGTKGRNPIQNRLCQRLQYECPEICKTVEKVDREWLKEPPAVFFQIAGIDIDRRDRWKARRQQKIDNSIGSGISELTQDLAKQLIQAHELELKIERRLEQELESPLFNPYHAVFDKFKIGNRIRAALLSRIYPIEDFLGEDNKPIIEYIINDSGKRSKRDRSEAAFKLSLGMGKILFQSGNLTTWKTGGSRYARTAIWQYVTATIKMGRVKKGEREFIGVKLEPQFRPHPTVKIKKRVISQPWENTKLVKAVAIASGESHEVSKLRLHYEFQEAGKIGDQRVTATASKMIRMLYRELIKVPQS